VRTILWRAGDAATAEAYARSGPTGAGGFGGVPGGGDGGDRDLGPGGQLAAPLVVGVDHADAGEAGGEQARLDLEVLVHAGVEVQVVLGQVGEHHDVVGGAGDPAQGQRVARDLHRGRRHPAPHHLGQQRLQVGGLGRGELTRRDGPGHPGLHPAQEPGHMAGPAQAGLQQVGGAGLAAGAGHADERQAAGRVPVDPGRDLAQPGARVGDHEDRQPAVPGQALAVRVGEHRHRPGGGRVVTEARAVMLGAREGCVQVTGPHPA